MKKVLVYALAFVFVAGVAATSVIAQNAAGTKPATEEKKEAKAEKKEAKAEKKEAKAEKKEAKAAKKDAKTEKKEEAKTPEKK